MLLTLADGNLTEGGSVEDQYRIFFLGAVWPERLYGIDFFEKCSEFGPTHGREVQNWSELDLRPPV